MKLSTKNFGLIVLIVFWGVVFTSMATGTWITKEPLSAIETVSNPGEIKGWMTIEDIANDFNLPVEEVISVLGLPEDADKCQQIKTFAQEQGKEVSDFRELIAEHLGVEIEGTSE